MLRKQKKHIPEEEPVSFAFAGIRKRQGRCAGAGESVQEDLNGLADATAKDGIIMAMECRTEDTAVHAQSEQPGCTEDK